MNSRYIAHRSDDGQEDQTLQDHLKNVSELAATFAAAFSSSEYGRYIGALHDIGKYADRWQRYIRGLIREKIDHSTAGAKEACKIYGKNAIGYLMAYCISGHHAGLLNGGTKLDLAESEPTLCARLQKVVDDYSAYAKDTILPPKVKIKKPESLSLITDHPGQQGNFSLSFYIRMLFSCLVDADYLDTESYMKQGKIHREYGASLTELKVRFDRFIEEHRYLEGKSGINFLRSGILKDCIREGREANESFFTLTVPTGGGKTLSSMAFALEYAVRDGMRHIIYVIPYCSIIDQTVEQLQKIFGEENVLAAYSNVDYEDSKENLRLASENWDKPIIVTTAVQFFESLYSNKPSRCRKLHNIAKSVLVFDEAQMIPEFRLRPCIRAIKELGINYQSICVLCTATQPAFQPYFEKTFVNGADHPYFLKEICHNPRELYDEFKRVSYRNLGKQSDEQLAEKMNGMHQALCIVSTRKQAKNIYRLLEGEGCFQLSTLLTAADRIKKLALIRENLKKDERCIVVSTSLIEAGVDVDFPCVFRAKAGLDNIIQSGGRCNREGKRGRENSFVYIFEPEDQYRLPSFLSRAADITDLVARGADDIASLDIVERYFSSMHEVSAAGSVDGLDIDDIVEMFEISKHFSYPFKTAADKFRMINSESVSVFIPNTGDAVSILYKLQNDLLLARREYRYIQTHSVNIYENDLKKIEPSLVRIDDYNAYLNDLSLYNDEVGLDVDQQKMGEALFF